MIDLKFHVYSIVGIFLALAIGMIIGNTLNKDANLTKANNKTMNRYTETIKVLKDSLDENNKSAEYQKILLDANDDFVTYVTPDIIKNKLVGRNIAIFSISKNDEMTSAAKRNIEIAGGKVANVTVVKKTGIFFDNDKKSNTQIDDIIEKCGHGAISDATQKRSKLYRLMVNLIAGKSSDFIFNIFNESNIFSLVGNYKESVDSILIIGDNSKTIFNDVQAINLIITAMKDSELCIVGMESAHNIKNPSVWASESIPFIDNGETALGHLSLIFALADKSGTYGVRKTAEKEYPNFLENNKNE